MTWTRWYAAPLLLVTWACGAPAPSLEGTTPAAASEETSPPSTVMTETPEPVPLVDPSNPYQVIVAAADRSADDRKLDAGRRPAELLAFVGVQPGMRVADLAAGGGYTTELLARAVGPTGKVYGQNSPWLLQRFAEGPWSARLQTSAMQNVTRLDREFDAPFPEDLRDLDAVVNVLFYHDTYWLNVDRDRMNQAIFTALKPGGAYIVVDHSGRDGTLSTEVKTLHRIEEKLVRAEILRAGFTLAEEGTFLRNASDARDWNASPGAAAERRGTSDRFVLKFVKPVP